MVFEDYDLPGLQDRRPHRRRGRGEAAWFVDPDGNVLCVHQVAGGWDPPWRARYAAWGDRALTVARVRRCVGVTARRRVVGAGSGDLDGVATGHPQQLLVGGPEDGVAVPAAAQTWR